MWKRGGNHNLFHLRVPRRENMAHTNVVPPYLHIQLEIVKTIQFTRRGYAIRRDKETGEQIRSISNQPSANLSRCLKYLEARRECYYNGEMFGFQYKMHIQIMQDFCNAFLGFSASKYGMRESVNLHVLV